MEFPASRSITDYHCTTISVGGTKDTRRITSAISDNGRKDRNTKLDLLVIEVHYKSLSVRRFDNADSVGKLSLQRRVLGYTQYFT